MSGKTELSDWIDRSCDSLCSSSRNPYHCLEVNWSLLITLSSSDSSFTSDYVYISLLFPLFLWNVSNNARLLVFTHTIKLSMDFYLRSNQIRIKIRSLWFTAFISPTIQNVPCSIFHTELTLYIMFLAWKETFSHKLHKIHPGTEWMIKILGFMKRPGRCKLWS